MTDLAATAHLDYCYLTTTGRSSGLPREIEIWFALQGRTLYLLAGGRERAYWVRNIRQSPAVSVRLGDRALPATGRILEPGTPEDALARSLLYEKYNPGYAGELANWRDSALPVALDLQP